jgi:hypothetical protein
MLLFRCNDLCQKIRHIKTIAMIEPVTKRYLAEVYGDVAYSLAIINAHQYVSMKWQHQKETEICKDTISSKRLSDFFTLEHSNDVFLAFREYVDRTIRKIVLDTYGNFSEFTTPLLSSEHIHDFAERFKTLFGNHYQIISIILHKHVTAGHSRTINQIIKWDHMIFYVFCMLARIRIK